MTLSCTSDPCSFSNPHFYTLNHLSLDWHIDFAQRILHGSALLHLERKSDDPSNTIVNLAPFNSYLMNWFSFLIKVLDTRELEIESIVETGTNTSLSFECGASSSSCFGAPLKVLLSAETKHRPGQAQLHLLIAYKTSATASALQWLEANCTMGKQHPYLFSQCQVLKIAISEISLFLCN